MNNFFGTVIRYGRYRSMMPQPTGAVTTPLLCAQLTLEAAGICPWDIDDLPATLPFAVIEIVTPPRKQAPSPPPSAATLPEAAAAEPADERSTPNTHEGSSMHYLAKIVCSALEPPTIAPRSAFGDEAADSAAEEAQLAVPNYAKPLQRSCSLDCRGGSQLSRSGSCGSSSSGGPGSPSCVSSSPGARPQSASRLGRPQWGQYAGRQAPVLMSPAPFMPSSAPGRPALADRAGLSRKPSSSGMEGAKAGLGIVTVVSASHLVESLIVKFSGNHVVALC